MKNEFLSSWGWEEKSKAWSSSCQSTNSSCIRLRTVSCHSKCHLHTREVLDGIGRQFHPCQFPNVCIVQFASWRFLFWSWARVLYICCERVFFSKTKVDWSRRLRKPKVTSASMPSKKCRCRFAAVVAASLFLMHKSHFSDIFLVTVTMQCKMDAIYTKLGVQKKLPVILCWATISTYFCLQHTQFQPLYWVA